MATEYKLVLVADGEITRGPKSEHPDANQGPAAKAGGQYAETPDHGAHRGTGHKGGSGR